MLINLKNNISTTRLALALLTIFLIISNTVITDDIHILLSNIIENDPNNKVYFPLYVILGLILPIILRLKSNDFKIRSKLLDSYLILLSSQILTELLLVPSKGKGIGFIIGMIFTLFRLNQLILFKQTNSCLRIENLFIHSMIAIWGYNLLHIVLYRLIPLGKIIIFNG